MSGHVLFERLRAELSAAQRAGGLDSATAGKILTDIGHGQRPASLPEAGGEALLRLGWLLFKRAPSLDGRYVALGPMNVAFVAGGMRTPVELVDELAKLEAVSAADPAPLEHALTLHGEALVQLALSGTSDLAGARLTEHAEVEEERRATAAEDGRWTDIPVEGPDADAVRAALRFLPPGVGQQVHGLWSAAATAVEEERLDDARSALDEAGKLAPDLFETWLRRARVRFAAGDRVGAGADVERAIQLNPAASTPKAMRAELRTIVRDLPGAMADWDAAVQAAPGHVPFRLGRGYTLLAANRLDDAFAELSEAVRLAPKDKTAWFSRAELRVRRRDLRGAAEDYTAILGIDPDDLQAVLNRGTVRLMARDSEAALADLTRVVDLRPADPTAWGRRGAAQIQLGHPWRGWLDGLTALALAPDDWAQSEHVEQIVQAAYQQLPDGEERPDVADLRARVELVERKASGREVVRMADRLGTWLPSEGVAWHAMRGDLYLRYGRWAQAEAAFRDALAVDAADAGATLGLGRALLGQGRTDDALAALDRAKASAWGLDDEGTFELHLARGRALGTAGRFAEAVAALDEALALRPDRADVWFYKGVHASLHGDGAAADLAYCESLKHNEGFAPAWFNRACERARLGRAEEALSDLERAVALERKWANEARTEAFFAPLRGLPRFEAIVAAA